MEKGFLAEKEVHNVRPLWEKVFAEDSKEFTEYYFANKAERNLVFIRTDEEKIVSMLHLTPFLTGRMEPVCYIVGVATEEQYRRQGLMADLLKEALQFMWEEGQPFTFLMPANPAYYTPFQFTYVYDKPVWKLNEAVLPLHYMETAAKYEAEFHLVVKGKGSLQIKVA
ncbi:MAG: GNAT family N-acetyltransferase, partial [Lachnospiraceae bacterium]|nr:GNAT family N-acetyltransferase [Lachnospiraceae bacterium]